VIVKLTQCCRTAVVNCSDDAKQGMLFATLTHCRHTDTKSEYSKCPCREKSSCFYSKTITMGETLKSHKEMVHIPPNNLCG